MPSLVAGLFGYGRVDRLAALGLIVVLLLLPHAQAFEALLFAQPVGIVLHQERRRLASLAAVLRALRLPVAPLAAVAIAAAAAPAAALATLTAVAVAVGVARWILVRYSRVLGARLLGRLALLLRSRLLGLALLLGARLLRLPLLLGPRLALLVGAALAAASAALVSLLAVAALSLEATLLLPVVALAATAIAITVTAVAVAVASAVAVAVTAVAVAVASAVASVAPMLMARFALARAGCL